MEANKIKLKTHKIARKIEKMKFVNEKHLFRYYKQLPSSVSKHSYTQNIV